MNSKWSDLRVRVLSALCVGGLALFATWYHADSFTMLLLIAGYILGREWQKLNISNDIVFSAVGYVYVVGSVFSLYWIRSTPLPLSAETPAITANYIWLLFAIVWGTDIGAYFVGKLVGGAKLWPSVSPNKTRSGAIGGALVACIAAYGVTCVLSIGVSLPLLALMVVLASAAAQLGDLFESHLKRRAGVKDSGNLIPGHGGLFDRVDGLMAASPIFALMVSLL